ncbi:MAG: hypothetical protein PVF58_19185 [Candidatus Methanofastidiosia archaeon]|jgi:multisubunit Na+/H+ antiporter MnhB subunit
MNEKRHIAAALLIIVWGITIGTGVSIEYGTPLNETAAKYIERTYTDTNALNVVTAILADYRLYDTIGEATVLFAAILGVTLILGRNHHKTAQKIKQMDKLYGGKSRGNVYYR